jgi:SynChlorMet cassette radical SAM/SPASM protein ScmF
MDDFTQVIHSEEADQKNWNLQTIYFYLTGDCNLACRHCWISPRYQKTTVSTNALDFDLIPSIISEAKPLGLSCVKLTGGEPLIHPEIHRIFRLLKKEGLGVVLETNGVAVTHRIAEELQGFKNPFVSVSLDGSDPETHDWIRGVPGSFQQAGEGVKILVEHGLKPQIIMTLMRKNVNQIEEVMDLAENLGAGSVKFNILQPTARGKTMHERGENLSIEELLQVGAWIEDEVSRKRSISLIFGHPAAFKPLNRLFGEKGSCNTCNIHHIIGVLSNGSYAVCGIGQNVPEMILGNARDHCLAGVWEHHPLLKKIRTEIPKNLKGICNECLMSNICLGSCVAQNFYSNNDLLAPFWYCKSAYQKGLFPATRVKNSPP